MGKTNICNFVLLSIINHLDRWYIYIHRDIDDIYIHHYQAHIYIYTWYRWGHCFRAMFDYQRVIDSVGVYCNSGYLLGPYLFWQFVVRITGGHWTCWLNVDCLSLVLVLSLWFKYVLLHQKFLWFQRHHGSKSEHMGRWVEACWNYKVWLCPR